MINTNKNNITIVGIVCVIVLIMLFIIGNMIIIGDKIASINPILSYLFYSIISILLIWLIIIPILRVIITPPFRGIKTENIADLTPTQTSEYILNLRRSIKLTREEDRELRLGHNRKETLEKILNQRHEEMEEVIKKSAISNFAVTAISQNGSLDLISSMVINLRMINRIVNKLGKRPSYAQLFKLYFSVLSASLLITTLDDIIDEIDFDEILGSIIGKVGNIIIPSATNGLMNAFVTLRVGYATIKYIEVGNNSFDKAKARKYAFKLARKNILNVSKEGIAEILYKIKRTVNKMNDI